MTTTGGAMRDEVCTILWNLHAACAGMSVRFKELKEWSQRLNARHQELSAEADTLAEAGDSEPARRLVATIRAATVDGQRLSAALMEWDRDSDTLTAETLAHVERLRTDAAAAGLDFDAIDEEARLVLAHEREARPC